MNRDDLLKRCVDRRVAHETSIVAVSHLFYVYLLSALKKGQRVEVPNFGTFGTHIVGTKRVKKMPFFEADKELAEKVNESYRNLKPLVLGKFVLTPVSGEVEYTGKEVPYDRTVEQVGKEIVVDTYRELSPEEFKKGQVKETETAVPAERTAVETRVTQLPPKEKRLMPSINLKDDEMEQEPVPSPTPENAPPVLPHLRETPVPKSPSPLVQILLLLALLGVVTFALNYFGVIHLWGKKATTVVEAPPSTEQPKPDELQQPAPKVTPAPPEEQKGDAIPMPQDKVKPTPSPKAETKPAPTLKQSQPPAGEGRFTLQVSSWTVAAHAGREAARIQKAGFDAFVETGEVAGVTRYRVRVGRYATKSAALADVSRLADLGNGGPIVALVGK